MSEHLGDVLSSTGFSELEERHVLAVLMHPPIKAVSLRAFYAV